MENNKFTEKNLKSQIVRIFVFGTLLKGQRFEFYMDGSLYCGKAYSRGQLMMAENGSVYIDVTDHNVYTMGEVYLVDYSCLKRINHLEGRSGEFPKGYDLTMIPTWNAAQNPDFNFDLGKCDYCFYYRRRNQPVKIIGGDYTKHYDPVDTIGEYIQNADHEIADPNEIVNFMKQRNINIDF
jgi:gamma-glutamylcyclotransferase (GGCT)/AIG2-like uncharacterized protein YtfP